MTVSNQKSKVEYTANGTSKNFEVPFYFIRKKDLVVYRKIGEAPKELLKQDIDYSISGSAADKQSEIGYPNGGTVVLAEMPLNGTKITIMRVVELTQLTDYQEAGTFPAKLHEQALDKLTMQIQQLAEEIDRAVKIDVFSESQPSELIDKVESLYEIKDHLITLSNDIAAINTVAGAEAELLALHGKLAELVAVYGKLPQVQTVSDAVNDVVLCAAEIAAIKDAPNQATAAGAAASAALVSQNASAVSQSEAKQSELKAAAYAERVRSEGIPMSIIEQKRISIDADGRTVRLWWKDPRDTIIDGYVIASWDATVIVKKQGAYPEDIDDGVIVATVTDRDSHLDDALTDEQENAAAWKYRAFPRSVNGVYCLDKRNCFGVWVYGYYIDEAAPVTSTRVHKIEGCDNYFYERAYMDFENNRFEWGDWRNAPFLPRPCMLKRSGEVAYYLDPDNYLKKEDGTASDVANSAFDGNAMMEWNTVFMKKYRDRNRIYVFFSNVKQDSGFECFSTLKSDGTYAEHFYTPIYEGNLVDNVMRSLSLNMTAQSGSTADQEAAYAEANGAGWTTTVWADEDLITALFVLMFENTDSQAALGNGNINGGTSAAAFLPTGSGNQKGMFWGSNTNNQCVKVFGMENWWGNRWRRPNGVLLIEGIYHVKMTHSTADGSTTTGYNRTGAGYINTGLTTEGDYNAAYISRVHAGKYGFLVAKAAGSATTFYADGHWSARTGTRMLLRGGNCAVGALCGAFAFTVNGLPSFAFWAFGASLSYRNS